MHELYIFLTSILEDGYQLHRWRDGRRISSGLLCGCCSVAHLPAALLLIIPGKQVSGSAPHPPSPPLLPRGDRGSLFRFYEQSLHFYGPISHLDYISPGILIPTIQSSPDQSQLK